MASSPPAPHQYVLPKILEPQKLLGQQSQDGAAHVQDQGVVQQDAVPQGDAPAGSASDQSVDAMVNGNRDGHQMEATGRRMQRSLDNGGSIGKERAGPDGEIRL